VGGLEYSGNGTTHCQRKMGWNRLKRRDARKKGGKGNEPSRSKGVEGTFCELCKTGIRKKLEKAGKLCKCGNERGRFIKRKTKGGGAGAGRGQNQLKSFLEEIGG